MNAVVIMAKAPISNVVKTRLVPPLNPKTASELYKAFLLDKIDQVRSLDGIQSFLAYAPKTAEGLFREFVPREFILIPQVGSDLGERLANVSDSLFHEGFRKIIISDSDTPNLPTDRIRNALHQLNSHDTVIGPCEDGGYYLIGLRTNIPELFAGIPWSSPDVVQSTVNRIRTVGGTVSLLEKWYDVDTFETLLRLKRDLESKPHVGFFCRNSYEALRKIVK